MHTLRIGKIFLMNYKWLAFVLAATSVFFLPAKTKKIQTKMVQKSLNIQAAKSDPPRIAFNKIYESVSNKNWPPEKPAINLNKNVEEKFTQSTVYLIKSRKVSLKPLIISYDKAILQLKEDSWIEKLTPDQKQRLLAVQNIESHIKNNADEISYPIIQTNDEAKITGKVILRNGAALTDGHIEISKKEDGAHVSLGAADPKTGSFSIPLGSSSGTIIATVYDKNGNKTGQGSVRSPQSSEKSDELKIPVVPASDKVAAYFYQFDKELSKKDSAKKYARYGAIQNNTYFASLDTNKNSDASGDVAVDNILSSSWLLARTEAKGYYPALSLVSESQNIPLFREAFVQALISLNRENQVQSSYQENNSVIWGQVKFDGSPIAGIKVETEFSETHKTVYFNNLMIPDPQLTSTSENGYFAILHLPEGFHTLLAYRGDEQFSYANVQTEEGTISHTNIEATFQTEAANIKVYDAFTGKGISTSIDLQSLDDTIFINQQSEVRLQPILRHSLMRSIPQDGEYFSAMYIYSEKSDEILVPHIRKDWIDRTRNTRKINEEPKKGTIVGFFSEEVVGDVYLSHDENYLRNNIVYFNSLGEPVDYPAAGGGYILFNVLPGTHSVVVVDADTDKIDSTVVPVETEIINIIKN